MNDRPDDLDSTLDAAHAANGTLDPALDAALRVHFGAQRTPPPDPAAIWQRLAPQLEARETPSVSASRSAVATDTPPAPPVPFQRAARPLRRAGTSRPPASRLRRTISSIAAVAAVLLLSLGSFALFHQLSGVATGGQTIQRGHLTWHLVTLPPGVVLANGAGVTESHDGQTYPAGTPAGGQPNATLTVAPANGDIAYICQLPVQGVALLWRTTDAGRDWSRLPDLHASGAFTACGVQTDMNNALTVMVTLGTPSTQATAYSFYVLFDGTTSWRQLPEAMGAFAYSRGIYYGQRNTPTPGAGRQLPQGHLYVSTDHMLTWREIDAPLIAENLAAAKRLKLNGATGVSQFWVNPETGELLAQTYDGVLWRSVTNGATWTQIALPALPPAAELTPTPGEMIWDTGEPGAALVWVQQPVADHPFTLCALVLDQTLTVYNVAPLYCSTDSGQTWVRRPRPAVPQSNGKPDQFELPRLMLPDGSLLAWDVTVIYRMPGNSTRAQPGFVVGTIPPPRNPNDIPGGMAGVTAHGVTLWQPSDTRTLYVAQYIG